jgi:hypothetical protein
MWLPSVHTRTVHGGGKVEAWFPMAPGFSEAASPPIEFSELPSPSFPQAIRMQAMNKKVKYFTLGNLPLCPAQRGKIQHSHPGTLSDPVLEHPVAAPCCGTLFHKGFL